MIAVKDVSKIYAKNVGNFNINLQINEGQVYGILGPNGAGKTTLIRQIMGFIKSDAGEILVNDLNPWTDAKKVMENVGYVAGEISLYDNLKGSEYLKLISKFKKTDETFLENLIKHFDIDVNRKIKKMSKGMKQKIALIAASMSKPKILILDEPTAGLDPVMQEQFYKLIFKMKNEKTTIIICSHIFEEVVKLCDQVGFIKDGKLIEEMTIKNSDLNEIETHFKKLYERKDFL